MKQRLFTSSISVTDVTLSTYGNHIVRRLSAMNRQYLDGQAYAATAIALLLFNKPSAGDRPRRFVKVGHSQGWTDRINQMFESIKTSILFEYILSEDPMRRFTSKTVGCTFCTVGLSVRSSLSSGDPGRPV